MRGGEGLETEPERGERWRNEKLRRGVDKGGRLWSGVIGEVGWNSEWCVGGVMTSWLKVSERTKVISGVGGEFGID